MAQEYHIIDADTHAIIPKDYFQTWWSKKYQNQAPKLVKDPERGAAWSPAPDQIQAIGLTVTPGMKYEDIRLLGHTYDDIRPGCYDAHARLKDLDIDGVDAHIMYSDNRIDAFMFCPDMELRTAAIEAHNNWVLQGWTAVDPSRLIGLAQIPNVGVEGAIH